MGLENLIDLEKSEGKLERERLYVNWPESSSSNAYLEIILNEAAVKLFSIKPDQIRINTKRGKNNDYTVGHIRYSAYLNILNTLFKLGISSIRRE
jgi:hypothetical protein